MGLIYIAYAGIDENNIHSSKLGFIKQESIDSNGLEIAIKTKVEYLNALGRYKKKPAYADLCSWEVVHSFSSEKIVYDLEQKIHDFLEREIPDLLGYNEDTGNRIVEYYNIDPDDLLKLVKEEFQEIGCFIDGEDESDLGY